MTFGLLFIVTSVFIIAAYMYGYHRAGVDLQHDRRDLANRWSTSLDWNGSQPPYDWAKDEYFDGLTEKRYVSLFEYRNKSPRA